MLNVKDQIFKSVHTELSREYKTENSNKSIMVESNDCLGMA